ncbi:MAG: hypothetical protein GXP42_10995 [Chloroflexi bacterium]|nr:hypothetical protein [Chloroflexota bacterium]
MTEPTRLPNPTQSSSFSTETAMPEEDRVSPTAEPRAQDAAKDEQEDAGEVATEHATLAVGPHEETFDAYRALVRLLIGAGVEGAELLLRLLQEADAAAREAVIAPAAPKSENTATDRFRRGLVGLMIEASEIPRQGFRLGWRLANAAAQMGLSATSPMTNSRLAQPIRRRVEEAAIRGQAQVERWIELGGQEEERSRALTRAITEDAIAEIVQALAQDPSIRMLVQVQGDTYIEYLQQENPDAVQSLVQGQSLSMAGQLVEEVRERTVTGDSLIETLARALLRRPPREELPPSPPKVKALSDTIRVRRQKQTLENHDEAP